MFRMIAWLLIMADGPVTSAQVKLIENNKVYEALKEIEIGSQLKYRLYIDNTDDSTEIKTKHLRQARNYYHAWRK